MPANIFMSAQAAGNGLNQSKAIVVFSAAMAPPSALQFK